MADEEKPKKSGIFQVFKDIVYGMSSHEMTRQAVRSRASMEANFVDHLQCNLLHHSSRGKKVWIRSIASAEFLTFDNPSNNSGDWINEISC